MSKTDDRYNRIKVRSEGRADSDQQIHDVETGFGVIAGLLNHPVDPTSVASGVKAKPKGDFICDEIGTSRRAGREVVDSSFDEIHDNPSQVGRESIRDAERLPESRSHAQRDESITHGGSVSATSETNFDMVTGPQNDDSSPDGHANSADRIIRQLAELQRSVLDVLSWWDIVHGDPASEVAEGFLADAIAALRKEVRR